jgi:polysaccharide biosynthesis protein PslH
MPLKILSIITYKFIKPTDGGKNGIYYQHKYLANHATLMAAGVAANEIDTTLNYELIPIFSSGIWRYINPITIFKIRNIIKQNKIDIILFQHPYLGWMIPILRILCNVKFAVRSHNVEYMRFKDLNRWWWRGLQWYENWVQNNIDYLLCVTEDDHQFFKENGTKSKIIDLPYGTEINAYPIDRPKCKEQIIAKYDLDADTKIILFNGSFGYAPNIAGLDIILEKVNPILLNQNTNYKILICGGGLQPKYDLLKAYSNKNIIYCGFVDDISIYFKAADIFLNAVQGGGGVKTKLVEALAFGCTCISSEDGAGGIVKNKCGNQLITTPNYDAEAMAKKVIIQLANNESSQTPSSFYDYYNWDSIMKRVVGEMRK